MKRSDFLFASFPVSFYSLGRFPPMGEGEMLVCESLDQFGAFSSLLPFGRKAFLGLAWLGSGYLVDDDDDDGNVCFSASVSQSVGCLVSSRSVGR